MFLLCRFSADATRFALANAGDTLDDANFDIELANAAILLLFNEEEWIKNILSQRSTFRVSTDRSEWPLIDQIFDEEMNELISITRHHYSRMLFREACQTYVFI